MDIGALTLQVEANEVAIDDLEGDVDDNEEDIVNLQSTVETNTGLLGFIEGDIDDLQDLVDTAAASALIEDFFEVNADRIQFEEDADPADLVDPFCAGPGVFIFQLAVNYASEATQGERTPNIETMLIINGGDPVALSFVFDEEEPTNVNLFYEGVLDVESSIEVKAGSGFRTFRVEPLNLQWGYKLYGESYNLITETSNACLA